MLQYRFHDFVLADESMLDRGGEARYVDVIGDDKISLPAVAVGAAGEGLQLMQRIGSGGRGKWRWKKLRWHKKDTTYR